MKDHQHFLERALEISITAYKSGKGLPIGCVIVRDGKIIAEGHNEVFAQMNPTAHAEMVVIAKAAKELGKLNLEDCILYTTVEPCPMCLSASYWAKIGAIYYAVTSEDAATVRFDDSFIFAELRKTKEERMIPLNHIEMKPVLEVLKHWNLLIVISPNIGRRIILIQMNNIHKETFSHYP